MKDGYYFRPFIYEHEAISYSSEIKNAVLMIDGEAYSCYFSKDAFKKLTGDNKELLIIPDAVHRQLQMIK